MAGERVTGGSRRVVKIYFCEIRANPASDLTLNFSSLRTPQNALLNQFSP